MLHTDRAKSIMHIKRGSYLYISVYIHSRESQIAVPLSRCDKSFCQKFKLVFVVASHLGHHVCSNPIVSFSGPLILHYAI